MSGFLEVHRGTAPLIVSFPHTGTDVPVALEDRYCSSWLARKDTDWWVERLYSFARTLGATTVRTTISRSVIDVNRDPSGASLYPGQATTELCPTTTFDGEPLYRRGGEPDNAEIARRRETFFVPYHTAITEEIARLKRQYPIVVLYDAHSIRSTIPRLFDGVSPHFNIGTDNGTTCDPALGTAVDKACMHPDLNRVTDGRFKGGWTVRHYGKPQAGIHAIQMELACRSYMNEPTSAHPDNWPTPYDIDRATLVGGLLANVLGACISFATAPENTP